MFVQVFLDNVLFVNLNAIILIYVGIGASDRQLGALIGLIFIGSSNNFECGCHWHDLRVRCFN